jgi:hypothetical protein
MKKNLKIKKRKLRVKIQMMMVIYQINNYFK